MDIYDTLEALVGQRIESIEVRQIQYAHEGRNGEVSYEHEYLAITTEEGASVQLVATGNRSWDEYHGTGSDSSEISLLGDLRYQEDNHFPPSLLAAHVSAEAVAALELARKEAARVQRQHDLRNQIASMEHRQQGFGQEERRARLARESAREEHARTLERLREQLSTLEDT